MTKIIWSLFLSFIIVFDKSSSYSKDKIILLLSNSCLNKYIISFVAYLRLN